MVSQETERATPPIPTGWQFCAKNKSEFQVAVEQSTRISDQKCISIKTAAKPIDDIGNFNQRFSASKYIGKRIQLSAWVMCELAEGHVQLWLRVDGDWPFYSRLRGAFDNMWPDRIITGTRQWQQHALVVDVPEQSSHIAFGLYHNAKGTVWVDGFKLEVVNKDVPLTGMLQDTENVEPVNLNFQD